MYIDNCSREGAERLARIIREYWQDKGFKVEVRAEHGPIGIFQVRSNLLNALPKCG